MIFKRLPESAFDVVLADPPWEYTGQQDKWGAAAKFYKTHPVARITTLPMLRLLAPRGVLFLWVTGPLLHLGFEAIKAWGLYPRGVAFVWVKTKKDGTPIGAQGVRPSIVKPLTEMVLAASRVREGRPMPLASESVTQTVFAPKRAHSQKPDGVQERIEVMYPHASKLELFARQKRRDWVAWGNEVPEEAAPPTVTFANGRTLTLTATSERGGKIRGSFRV